MGNEFDTLKLVTERLEQSSIKYGLLKEIHKLTQELNSLFGFMEMAILFRKESPSLSSSGKIAQTRR
jgi:hypothetical protein